MKFLYLSFILLLFLLVGCDIPLFNPGQLTSYTRSIDNYSSHDIWLINPNVTGNCDSSTFDSILVISGTRYEVEILSNTDASRNPNLLKEDYEDCPSICLDSLNARIHGHNSLKLNISLREINPEWVYYDEVGGMAPLQFSSGGCACLLVITDDDIN